ncbi:murein biosynthesis integral membrane protein MurJ [Aestuariispira insulae]|uniref:Probable lipid II flippase MurJ n=1 Tax=Aestuariispira insulae TaxID=1461337 RepID=A0A3D9HPQ5_9PROT|nr:murein biosynthesis integral membrane protein MurJ [Aestuariispira insulae]RED51468.1 putative peptidoglycan lipid II flippase [Aestuariispira insulae]
MSLLRSVATVGGWTMMSRVLGFIRDVMIANVVGAGMVADAFFMAFKFPNLFRRLFGEGAMNAAFVPLYAGRVEADGIAEARRFGGEVAAILVTFMLFFTIVCLAAMPWIMQAVAPGFVDDQEKFTLTVALAQITFPYLLFMVLCAQFSGMLNSVGKFAHAAAAPVLLNVVMITTLSLISLDVVSLPGHAMAVGVTIAGAIQFLFLARACHKAGVMVRLPRPRLTPGVKRLLILMAPGVLGAGVIQINVLIGDMLASLLREGSVSFLYYADRINQLPLGVVGVAVGIALLPLLTRQLKAGETGAANHSMNRALELSLFLTVPAAVALIAMPWPIVTVLFERGEFDAATSVATADALRAYAIGLPAYVLIKALSPGFFAREDTRTPVRVAMINVALNIALAVILMQFLAHVGIALAVAVTAWANTIALAVILVRRGHFQLDQRLKRILPRLTVAAGLMGAALYFATGLISGWLQGADFLLRLASLTGLVAGGGLLYLVTAQILGAADLREVKGMLKRGKN